VEEVNNITVSYKCCCFEIYAHNKYNFI